MLLEGKSIVTTSAGSIGTVIARELLRHGARVEVWDISEQALARLQQAATVDGLRPEVRLVDVTSEKSVESAARAAVAAMRQVDALVCSAALLDICPVVSMPLERWKRIMEVNVTGVFLCNRAVVPHMVARRQGSIINMSSVGGLRGIADLSAYCASKFAVNGFTEALAHEVGEANVRVNAICPGQVDAAMGDTVIDYFSRKLELSREDYVADAVANTALRRLTTPEDVANLVVYLASDLSAFVTGEWLEVSGGLTY